MFLSQERVSSSVSQRIVWMGLVGEHNGFLMTYDRGCRRRNSPASRRLRATAAFRDGTPNFTQSLRAKSRSRSILIASPVGLKTGTLERSNSAAHGAWAQSMDIGKTTSILFRATSGQGLGKAS